MKKQASISMPKGDTDKKRKKHIVIENRNSKFKQGSLATRTGHQT